MKAILIYSGGMDSTVLLHQFRESIELAISFNYGSKQNHTEIGHAALNCGRLQVQHKIIDLSILNRILKSDLLLSGGKIEDGAYSKEKTNTCVPFRNGIMLSLATGVADSEHMNAVFIANHSSDFIYPDCSYEFINSLSMATQNGTYNRIEIISPYCKKTKRDIAEIGREIGVDFSNTYSCYKGEKNHCGVCATCIDRKEALKGFDTTIYEN